MSGILTEPERVDDGLVVVDRDLLEVNVGGVRHRHNRVAVLIQPEAALLAKLGSPRSNDHTSWR